MATRWRSPARVHWDTDATASSSPTLSQQAFGLFPALAPIAIPFAHGDLDVLQGGQSRQQMKRLKDKAHRLGAVSVEVP